MRRGAAAAGLPLLLIPARLHDDARRLRQGGAQGGQPHGGATGQVAQVEPQDASRLPRKAASAYALCAAVLERATRLLRRPIFQTKKFLTKS